jgi:hypothetical protein
MACDGNVQTLYDYGARKLVINSLGPVGCAPEQLNFYGSKDGQCLEWVNAPLRDFNVGLRSLVLQIRAQYPEYNLVYANCYDLIKNFVDNPAANGKSAITFFI